ncbi:MAG: hypothetical protein KZQ93_03055 [Candidatus Thiodiazotropha sp. (ex Monitilora ramsayi)]|nr:hypothetical protein [Candidatus Thiodiazotropha sp. (ex Monitilora ramsayi)]
MCITIPSSANVKKARQWLFWQWLSATPLRLFTAGGVLCLAGTVLQAITLGLSPRGWTVYNLLFSVLPILLLGPLLTYLPYTLRVSAVSYVRYVLLFSLLLASQVVFYLVTPSATLAVILYLSLLLPAWIAIILSIKGMQTVSYSSDIGLARTLFYTMVLAGVVGLTAGVGLLLEWPYWMSTAMWSVVPLYIIAAVCLAALVIRRRSLQTRR